MAQTRPLNRWMLTAAVLMTLTVFIHVFMGGPEVADPLRASTLDPVVRSVLSVIWHGVTVVLAVFAAGLFWLTRHANPAMAWIVIAVQVGFAGLFLGYGWVDLQTLMRMPQWIIFLGIPALMLMGLRRT